MSTYASPSRTKVLDTVTTATLEDSLYENDIPQAYRNALLCQLTLGMAKEPGLFIQGQNLKLPGGVRPTIKTQGGTRCEVFVNFEVGKTAQSFIGTDILETAQADGPTVTWTDYAYYTAMVSIALTEKIENSGAMKRLDILRSRQNQEIRQMARVMEADLWSTNGDTTKGSQNDFSGMQHKVQDDPTAASTVQGLSQATFTPWRNATDNSVGSFASGGVDAMRSMWFSVSGTNGMEPPHLITTNSTIAGYVIKELEGVHRIVNTLNDRDLSASRLPTFMGVPIVHSDDSPSGVMLFWNFDYLCSIIQEGANWSTHIPGTPNDQAITDQQRWVFGAAPNMITRRERFGWLGGITA